MNATLLRLTPAVRETVKDARAIERRLCEEGATSGPALGKTREQIADPARVREWRKPGDEQ